MKKFNFSVAIKEAVPSDAPASAPVNMKIRGEAIHATVTRNKTRFPEEELSKSAKTLQGRPLLKDHSNSVDSVVGKVTMAAYDDKTKCVLFEADVMDALMMEKIRQGLVGSVSVGAMADMMPELDEASGEVKCYCAQNIEFVELSLVAVPADPNANFERAIAEAFNLKEDSPVVTPTAQSEEPVPEPASEPTPETTPEEHSEEENKEANEVAEEENKLAVLREERAKLEAEVEQMKIDKLKTERSSLSETETKGKIAPIEQKTSTVVLCRSELGGYAYEPAHDGRKNLNKVI